MFNLTGWNFAHNPTSQRGGVFFFSRPVSVADFFCVCLRKVDSTAVHLVNGIWGVIAAGLFAPEEGYSASYSADLAKK